MGGRVFTGRPSYCEKPACLPRTRNGRFIQELVGQRRAGVSIRSISGSRCSTIPIPYSMPREGWTLRPGPGIGGLGGDTGGVVQGSPQVPRVERDSAERASEGSQHRFLALDMQKDERIFLQGEDASLEELDLSRQRERARWNGSFPRGTWMSNDWSRYVRRGTARNRLPATS
jgi:hypothetical protein